MKTKKKNILIIATGGTIASRQGDDGLMPSMNIDEILAYLPGIEEQYNIQMKDLFSLDSSNIQPEEWVEIASSINDNYTNYDGIVVTHGTDTMAYTSSILTFILRNIPIPVVITGSQLPISNFLTDAIDNLKLSLTFAATGIPGIFLAFNRKIMLGCRSVKVRTTGFDAFESVNYPNVATLDSEGLNIDKKSIPKTKGEYSYKYNLCNDVFLIKLTPGLNPQIFDKLMELDYKGIVIEAFGIGGLHFIKRDLVSQLENLVRHNIPVVVSSQCLYERSDFSIYQTGKVILNKGVIQAFDMTSEAAVTKLIWALGQTDDMAKVKEFFETDFFGEITL